MIDKTVLIQKLDRSTETLLTFLASIDENLFNKRTGEGSWSPADVAEHLLILETKANAGMNEAHPTERSPDGKLGAMKLGLGNLETKYIAPEFVRPTAADKNKTELIEGIRTQRELLKNLINTLDLTWSTELRHPVIGAMTRLEWVYFHIYHSQRHLEQLKQGGPLSTGGGA